MIASSRSGTPSPVLAEIRMISSAGMPRICLDLAGVAVGIGGGQVDLVERGDDLEVVLQREVAVGERLGLDALRGVDDEHDALARGEAAADLVAEVDVTRGVDQVEDVALPVDTDVLRLDRDAPLALEVHRVEVLRPHVAGVDGAGDLQDPVRQRRLAMVDVRDDREVADAGEVHDPANATGQRHPPTVPPGRTLLLRWPADRVSGLFDRCIGPRNATIDESTGFTAMANIKSQKKRILTNEKRHERNKAVKAEVKTRTKRANDTIGTDDNADAVRLAMKRIDRPPRRASSTRTPRPARRAA